MLIICIILLKLLPFIDDNIDALICADVKGLSPKSCEYR